MMELVAGLTVLGIVSVVGYPVLLNYLRTAKVKAAAQEFVTIANGARSIAIARNTNVCVILNANQARYMVGTTAACGGGATFVGTMTQADGSMPLTNNMEISGNAGNVVFTSLGAATPASVYTVRDPQTGLTLTVIISAAGRIRVQ